MNLFRFAALPARLRNSRRAKRWAAGLLLLGLAACQSADSVSPAPADAAQQDTAHATHGEEEPELAAYMSTLQRWAHKTALSVEARNQPLADFYLHELEETVEAVQNEVPTYEGYPVGQLTEQMLVPALDSLGGALDAGDWTVAREWLRAVATSCNQCHQATDHGFVEIRLHDLPNPYAQSFERRDGEMGTSAHGRE